MNEIDLNCNEMLQADDEELDLSLQEIGDRFLVSMAFYKQQTHSFPASLKGRASSLRFKEACVGLGSSFPV